MKARLRSLLRTGAIVQATRTSSSRQPKLCKTAINYTINMAQPDMKCMVIGLGGVTNGGKTTLCQELKEQISADSFHMDHYFWPADSENHVRLPHFNGHANWDTVEAVDFKRLHTDVTNWISKHSNQQPRPNVTASADIPVLFVEGILILNHKPLFDLYTKKYFLSLTLNECVERRNHRVYDPPDPAGYFEGIVWPMYLKSKAEIEHERSIDFISGAQDRNKILESMLNDIKNVQRDPSASTDLLHA